MALFYKLKLRQTLQSEHVLACVAAWMAGKWAHWRGYWWHNAWFRIINSSPAHNHHEATQIYGWFVICWDGWFLPNVDICFLTPCFPTKAIVKKCRSDGKDIKKDVSNDLYDLSKVPRVSVNEPFEGSEGYSWYCICQTVEARMYDSGFRCLWKCNKLLATCFTDPGFYIFLNCMDTWTIHRLQSLKRSAENPPFSQNT